LLGTSGGANGTGFSGPTAAPIDEATNLGQANTAYNGVQGAMQGQQGLLNALQNQNGLGNQSQVYGQLQGIANGTGPNPAQAMLNQQTGQNVANQAALMAGQRGSAQNVGLMARQAAQQGAATQQQAVGQGATMQANQSLNALGAAGNMANTMAGQQIGQTNQNVASQQGEQSNLLNAISSYNNANVGMQSNINNANAGLANTAMQGQQALLGGVMNGAGAALGMMMARGGVVQNFDDGGDVDDVQVTPIPASSGPTMTPDSGASALGGGGGSSGGGGSGSMMSMLPMLAMCMADGGGINAAAQPNMGIQDAPSLPEFVNQSTGKKKVNSKSPASESGSSAPQSGAAALYQGMSNLGNSAVNAIGGSSEQPAAAPTQYAGGPDSATDLSAVASMSAKGGRVNALVSPGERFLSPKAVEKVKKGASPMNVGEKIPGKPKVGGAKNSYANDTVPKKLEVGGIVLPRSVTQAKNPGMEARKFVNAVIAKRGKK
jgi:hypothetical protein